MNHRVYLMDRAFLAQLLQDRRELLEVARGLQTADAMRAAREELLQSMSVINLTPQTKDELVASYMVDDDGVAHIPVIGELTPQARKDICGAYTAEALTEYGFIVAATEAADRDERVTALAYEVDSPGGYFDGLMEAVHAIRSAEKPTTARVGSMAASAAYWLASQADRIEARSIGSRFGSIGVAIEEYDTTEMLAKKGITRRVYTSTDAPRKRPDTATDEGQAQIVEMLDDIHGVFARNVAEGRGVGIETVNEEFGRGGILIAEDALKVGMIDEIHSVASRRESNNPAEDRDNQARQEAGKTREVPMTREQLRQEHPALYAELRKEFTEAGGSGERERIVQLQDAASSDPDNAKLQEIVQEAIAGGKTLADVQTRVNVAVRDFKRDAEETPPAVATAQHDTASGETDGKQDADDEVKTGVAAVLAAAGYTKEV